MQCVRSSRTAKALTEAGLPFTLAPEPVRIQSAWGVALAAAHAPREAWGEPEPVYLRLSQAERERLAKLQNDHNQLLERDKGE